MFVLIPSPTIFFLILLPTQLTNDQWWGNVNFMLRGVLKQKKCGDKGKFSLKKSFNW